ncbi:type II toxin-antitoxin system VapC family toxin [Candidatus Bathyarchaeota archaeon]|nr:type II toxin-antitoxin system VapC family toxin [Candidatus Bathyarchaeota archaeon]
MSNSGAVLDASILAQTVVKEEYTELALRLIGRLESIYAPPLILYEIGNALVTLVRRGFITKGDALRKFKSLTAIPTLNIKEPTLDKAIEIAVELQITLYDASYLALALEIGVPFITADRELYEKGREVAETIHASEMT